MNKGEIEFHVMDVGSNHAARASKIVTTHGLGSKAGGC